MRRVRLSHLARSGTALALAVTSVAAVPAPDPVVGTPTLRRLAPGVWVIPDDRLVPLVPNIGIVEGRDAVLVIDTGLGVANGRAVRAVAARIAHGRRILLTTTHFHPEHSSGAAAFDAAAYVTSAAQAGEIRQKSAALDTQFQGFGPGPARRLRGFRVVVPGRSYAGETRRQLGGRAVILRAMPAHTRGDQIVIVPDAGVVFTGDLVEERSFPVLYDADARGARWIAVLKRLAAMRPRVLVPGHGHVADARMIAPQLAYLQRVQAEVGAAAARGWSQARTTAVLAPRLGRRHPDWQFKPLIPFEIAIFFAEATHRPPHMPAPPAAD